MVRILPGSGWGHQGIAALVFGAAMAACAAAFGADATTELRTQLGTATSSINDLTRYGQYMDPAHRGGIKDKVLPLLLQREDLLGQLAADPKEKTATRMTMAINEAELECFGDAAGTTGLVARAAAKNAAESTAGKAGQLLVRWWNAAGDAGEEGKVLDEMEAMSKAQPRNVDVTNAIKQMLNANVANVAILSRGTDIIDGMNNAVSKQYAKLPLQLGKPLVIKGASLNGNFDSGEMKGKVILVDCWATWCENCIASLPHVVEVYGKYHGQGLEIVGINSDIKRATLDKFLAKHSHVTWTQLFVGDHLIHPLAVSWGVSELPTAYLIDRQGNLRSVYAREQLDDLIPQLLAEKP